MKHLLLIVTLLLCAVGLAAQSGLYGLFFDATLAEADTILAQQGFVVGMDNSPSMIHYYPTLNDKVESITLVLEQRNMSLVGWMIKYNKNNTEREDNYVFETLTRIHTDWFKKFEETGQIVWLIGENRTVHLVYLDDGGLSVLYYDSRYDSLFHPNNSSR